MKTSLIFGVLGLWAVCALISVPVLAADDFAEELTKQKLLRYGMEQSEALKMLENEDDWDIAYRINTPSTTDIACRYQEKLYFQVRFYLGRCYYIEKRVECEETGLEGVFEHFHEQLGEAREATQSHDGKLLFSRWESDDRETTLTAHRRQSGKYMITFEEFEPEVIGIARHVQESELESMPTEHDPITGKERPAPGGANP